MFDPLDEVMLQLELVKAEKRRWKITALTLAGVLGGLVLGFAVMSFGLQRRAQVERALAEEARAVAEENSLQAQQAVDRALQQADEAREAELRQRLEAERKAQQERNK